MMDSLSLSIGGFLLCAVVIWALCMPTGKR